MGSLKELKNVLTKENLLDLNEAIDERYKLAIKNKDVRDILEIKTPEISDLSDVIGIRNGGRLNVVRMDLSEGVDNHKKSVVAGLILRGVLAGKIPKEGIDTLIDGGNINSARALGYYCRKFDINGIYVMSRLFPDRMLDLIRFSEKGITFDVIQAPKKYEVGDAIEREFYEHLVELIGYQTFRKNKYCLLHAKYGGDVMYPFGREIAEKLDGPVDHVVSCLGAGTTLTGLQIAVQDIVNETYGSSPKIIIPEHELSPLFAKLFDYSSPEGSLRWVDEVQVDPDSYEVLADKLPHAVIGPHFDEINNLIPEEAIARIDGVMQYSEDNWMKMQTYLAENGISVGNSSAANLHVAANLADKGNDVLTVIFEPFRDYYRK